MIIKYQVTNSVGNTSISQTLEIEDEDLIDSTLFELDHLQSIDSVEIENAVVSLIEEEVYEDFQRTFYPDIENFNIDHIVVEIEHLLKNTR